MQPVDRIELETSYLLHVRPYRETSQLLEVLSQRHGRVGLVARGARRPKSRWAAILRPFQPLHLSWSGRGSLHTLRAAEPASAPFKVTGMSLMAGYYMNELLIAFTHRGDPHPDLFAHYSAALAGLATGVEPELPLRHFEMALLSEIGYGLQLERDANSDARLAPESHYHYVIERGPVPAGSVAEPGLSFTGAELAAISSGDFHEASVAGAAKRLLRSVIEHHLAGRSLKTRQVLTAMRR